MGDIDAPLKMAAAGRAAAFVQDIPEDALQVDPLLDCLVELARLHGRPMSRTALAAGLPLPRGGLTPTLFTRAASRAGLAAKVIRRPLEKLDPATFPLVLVTRGDSACVLLGWTREGEARVLLPDTGQGEVRISRDDLAARYTNYAISVQPEFRFDARSPDLMKLRGRHWFWAAVAKQVPVYRDVLGAAFLISVFALVLPLFSMNVYDRVVPNFAVETLWMLAFGVAIVLVLDYVLRLLRGYFIDLAGSRIDVQLSTLIMEKVLGMRLEGRPASVGAYAATLRSFESIRDFIASATVTALVDVPFALVFLVVTAWICWPLVIPILVGMLAIVAYSWVARERMHRLAETTFRAANLRNGTLVESLTALETIKAHGAERLMQTRLEETTAFLSKTSGEQRLLASSVTNGVASVQQAVNVVTVVAGVYLINAGMLTMGGLIAAVMLGGRAMAPLAAVAGLMIQYHSARMALASLETTMEAPSERPEDSRFLHRPQLRGEIAFSNVQFNYPRCTQPFLKGVSFRIAAGEKVVILGRVGSGKTTVQRLMLGLYAPAEGAITMDGIDIRQIDPADLRRSIGYVAQDPMLFYGTLRDNITIAAPYADDAAVVAAAEIGGLSRYVNAHPEGFDMMIGERGESLSGGQRQGVAIARAALLDPPILLLDEPTGSMDSASEEHFKNKLRDFARDKTMVLVTHRSSLLDLATRIIVMDEGRVVADGPRDKLMDDLRSGRVGKAVS